MSAVSEGPIPFDHVSQEENSSDPVDAVIFFGISLVLGIASRHLLRGTRVPYTVALLVLGVALGSIGKSRDRYNKVIFEDLLRGHWIG